MKAIVLTFDEQVGFAELVYKKYIELWPSCPITFRIPYNSKKSCASYDYFNSKDNVELIESPSGIRQTMSALLSDIGDDEWVFWCIDDRYPVKNIKDTHDVEGSLNIIYNKIISGELSELSRVKIVSKVDDDDRLADVFKIKNIEFFKEDGKLKNFGGTYSHAFIKSKILKYYFLRDAMPDDYSIRKFHSLNKKLNEENFPWEDDGGSIILKNHILSFAEPAIFGMLTMNGLTDMQQYGCPMPNYDLVLCTRFIMDERVDHKKVYNYRIKRIGNMALPVISLK